MLLQTPTCSGHCGLSHSTGGRRAAVPAAAAAGPQNASAAMHCHLVQSPTALWPIQLRSFLSHTTRSVICQAGPLSPATYDIDFSPHVDANVLGAQLVVLAVTVGAAAYWWWAVVPTARRTLAKQKRAGPLNEYLLELQANPDKKVERWFYTDWLLQLQKRQQLAKQAALKRQAAADAVVATEESSGDSSAHAAGSSPAGETAAAAGSAGGPEQQDAEDNEPSFWSLDNPLLATGSFLAAVTLISTLLHAAQQ